MKNEDVKIGMKVVPFQKTIGCKKDHSNEWKRAKEYKQQFLYVVGNGNDTWVLSVENNSMRTGDYYDACDFEPYTEKKVITKNIKHIITNNKTIVVIQNEDGTYLKGESKCNPQDKFNEYEGFRVAYSRAVGKEPFKQYAKVNNKDKYRSHQLWRQFLEGKIMITCDNETYNDYFLNYCSQQHITWRGDCISLRRNPWTIAKHHPHYLMANSRLTLVSGYKLNHSTMKIINYREIFNNTVDVLSHFTDEELLEELRIRMKK